MIGQQLHHVFENGVSKEELPQQYKYKNCTHFFSARDEDQACYIQFLDLDAIVESRKKPKQEIKEDHSHHEEIQSNCDTCRKLVGEVEDLDKDEE